RDLTRDGPAEEPWGEVQLPLEDIGLDELCWEVGPDGFWIPAPRGLITATLARDMATICTQALRLTNPPTKE
ncbi:hypothetical protein AB0N61_17680, partial [Microbacterium sp. NPDC089320]|uniref:hypothetical protein n=1 Tax=Microbacterium sp. NPDC089320 TaxID=3155182 RepID=UPI00343061D6